MNDINQITDYILKRYILRNEGIVNITNQGIAEEVNALYNTTHTEQSVRGIWRRHNHKLNQPKPARRQTRYQYNLPLDLEGNIMFISDLHAPFIKEGFIEFLLDVQRNFGIKNVMCVGDLVDQCAVSFYDKNQDGLSAGSELEQTRVVLQSLAQHFPEMWITIGNHDDRHLRLATKAGLPLAYIKDFLEIFDLPETWHWHYSYIVNNHILVEHGTDCGMKATYDRAWATGMNVIQGHTHNYAGVTYMNDGVNKMRWAMNVGCGIDHNAYAFKYGTNRKFQPTLGVGIFVKGVPIFVPYYGK